jgi:hypothetical protein
MYMVLTVVFCTERCLLVVARSSVCVCVCARARVRACMRSCVRACVRVYNV